MTSEPVSGVARVAVIAGQRKLSLPRCGRYFISAAGSDKCLQPNPAALAGEADPLHGEEPPLPIGQDETA